MTAPCSTSSIVNHRRHSRPCHSTLPHCTQKRNAKRKESTNLCVQNTFVSTPGSKPSLAATQQQANTAHRRRAARWRGETRRGISTPAASCFALADACVGTESGKITCPPQINTTTFRDQHDNLQRSRRRSEIKTTVPDQHDVPLARAEGVRWLRSGSLTK